MTGCPQHPLFRFAVFSVLLGLFAMSAEGMIGQPAPAPLSWNIAQNVFSGKIVEAEEGPMGMSYPPLRTSKLQFKVGAVYRGQFSPGEMVQAHHSAYQIESVNFPGDTECVFAVNEMGRKGMAGYVAKRIEVATPELLDQVEEETSKPIGVAAHAEGTDFRCGAQVVFDVEQVDPPENVKYANPDGDGVYRVHLYNEGKEEVSVPCLRSVNGVPKWEEGLRVIVKGSVYRHPDFSADSTSTSPTRIPVGGRLTHEFNVLKIEGPEYPRGGMRMDFQFALGDRSAVRSFYYLSRHHDPIRENLAKSDTRS